MILYLIVKFFKFFNILNIFFFLVRLFSSLNIRIYGIVEIFFYNIWYVLCGVGFNDINVRVVCKEIGGFINGIKFFVGAFGKYYG